MRDVMADECHRDGPVDGTGMNWAGGVRDAPFLLVSLPQLEGIVGQCDPRGIPGYGQS
ncbi:hypothetical protein EDF58_10829 [Novosphingobium sp. PhB57]|jgi:hypothetical protein|nr:hypothetical protein EDF58_10829 [Novosphingobium sp. PhB57]